MNLPSHNLTSEQSLKQTEMLYGEIMKRFQNGDALPLLDPIDDMEIEDKQLSELIQAKNKINSELEKIAQKAQITPAQQMQYDRK
jgi:hypothetical protein